VGFKRKGKEGGEVLRTRILVDVQLGTKNFDAAQR